MLLWELQETDVINIFLFKFYDYTFMLNMNMLAMHCRIHSLILETLTSHLKKIFSPLFRLKGETKHPAFLYKTHALLFGWKIANQSKIIYVFDKTKFVGVQQKYLWANFPLCNAKEKSGLLSRYPIVSLSWHFTICIAVTVGSVEQTLLTRWRLSECGIYDSSPGWPSSLQ